VWTWFCPGSSGPARHGRSFCGFDALSFIDNRKSANQPTNQPSVEAEGRHAV